LFHDSCRDFSATLALGQEAIHDHKTEAENESLAENIRLLYVALTRAKMRCYCVWGPFRGAETSALAYILHGAGINPPLVQNLSAKLKSLSDDQIFSELRSIVEISPKGAFEIEILPDKEPTPLETESKTSDTLILREFTRPVPGPWKIASFSSLSYHYNDKTLLNPELMDSLDSDTLISEKPSDPVFSLNKPEGIFAFPKGALSGVFLHDVLEHTDFTNIGSPKTTNVILDTLAAHGFDLSWKPTIEHMLKNLVSVQLFPENNALRLCNIPRSDCLHELEFYFPLDLISSNDINSIVSNVGKGIEHAFQGLQFKPIQGYMKGFMDLVFT
jgi:exodeoxyribonuclease V beta subunit